MTSSDWATQQLAEFLAVLTTAADENTAVTNALERLAESFDAEGGAFVRGRHVMSSLGWSTGHAHEAEILAVALGHRTNVEIPGAGLCETIVIPVDRDEGSKVVLARSCYRFSAEEGALLRGMGRVLALALRLLCTVAVERRQAAENAKLVASLRDRQALLERLSSIQRQISSRALLPEVLNAVTAGVAEFLGDDFVLMQLVDESDPGFTLTASFAGAAANPDMADNRERSGEGVAGRAVVEDRLCVAENEQDLPSLALVDGRQLLRSAMAVPVRLEGRPAGSLVVASQDPERRYGQHERDILTSFAEHAGLALNDANTVQAMRKTLDDARHQAMHDELTGLPNRACFYDRTDQALRLASRDGTCTAVLLFDLNRFKEINDTLGHKFGDRVLREVGPRLRRGLRDSDTLARLGGDEFCVLLPRVEGVGDALVVARRVIELLEEPFDIDGMAMPVEASCGVAIAPVDGDSADLLLQRADVAMYVAKDSHASIVTYDDELNVNTPARLALLSELRAAVSGGQFVLYYQPKAALGARSVHGVEALVRWQHPTYGLVPPNDFIPLAEHTGLIKPLTSWVLNKALEQLSRWREMTGSPVLGNLSVAVNVSTRSLLDDDFPSEVADALERWDVPPHLLALEITESTIMADPSRAHRLLSELAATGVQVSIDDFGTGYSSLSYLKNLPVNELKIDRSFVYHMHRNPNDAVIVQSVIDLGRNLGLHTVAEGIEDDETWEHLRRLGCDSGQGYLLARPMPAEKLVGWLTETEARTA
ncbi:MAG: EAL domain-containing protein [Acidimicrobiales bacterium]|jgi:diguanylate cyclase (GGDEF)-like protein